MRLLITVPNCESGYLSLQPLLTIFECPRKKATSFFRRLQSIPCSMPSGLRYQPPWLADGFSRCLFPPTRLLPVVPLDAFQRPFEWSSRRRRDRFPRGEIDPEF